MTDVSRRQLLGATAALVTVGCSSGGGGTVSGPAPSPTPTPTPTPAPTASPTPKPAVGSVHAAGQPRGLSFGSAVAWSNAGADAGAFANPDYAALLERDCGVLVAENELKWQAIRPDAASYSFTRFDAMLAYAESKGMRMRGHTLYWAEPPRFPQWLTNHDFGATPATEAERLVTEHIRTVTRRYGTRIHSYDVVNEAVNNSTGAMRTNVLTQAMGSGEAVVDLAFRVARQEAPEAQLVYNDYMSWEGGPTHRNGVLRLLEGMKTRGVPCDALGIQGHIGIYSTTPVGTIAASQEAGWRAFLDEVVAMGYRLVLTELDCNDNGLPADIAGRDRAVADYTRAFLDITLSYPQINEVLVWGMCDRYSWLQGFNPRADGVAKRPLPYDSAFAAKPMRTAIAEALARAPVRAVA